MSGKSDRPKGHWIKRPPRPSRPQGPPPRARPGWTQAAMAAGVGLLSGIAGAGLAVAAQAPEGARGMMAGVAMCLGAILTWRAFGGTLQDVRDLWR